MSANYEAATVMLKLFNIDTPLDEFMSLGKDQAFPNNLIYDYVKRYIDSNKAFLIVRNPESNLLMRAYREGYRLSFARNQPDTKRDDLVLQLVKPDQSTENFNLVYQEDKLWSALRMAAEGRKHHEFTLKEIGEDIINFLHFHQYLARDLFLKTLNTPERLQQITNYSHRSCFKYEWHVKQINEAQLNRLQTCLSSSLQAAGYDHAELKLELAGGKIFTAARIASDEMAYGKEIELSDLEFTLKDERPGMVDKIDFELVLIMFRNTPLNESIDAQATMQTSKTTFHEYSRQTGERTGRFFSKSEMKEMQQNAVEAKKPSNQP